MKTEFAAPRGGLLNLRQHLRDERLSAEARIHRHHQQQIDLLEIRLRLRDAGGRIHGETDLHAERADLPQQLRHAIRQLDVDGQLVRARLGERFEENLRLRTHQVNVEEHLRQRTNRAHHLGTEGNVRDKMPVHDVQVQPLRAGLAGALRLGGKLAEVRGEQGRGDNHAQEAREPSALHKAESAAFPVAILMVGRHCVPPLIRVARSATPPWWRWTASSP